MGVECHFGHEITSMKEMLDEDFDAYFIGTGAPRGRDLELPGRAEVAEHISIGIDWLSSVAFGHTHSISGKVIVMGGGNTAMDCCRTAKRLGAESVTVVVRSAFEVMKASDWEKEDAMHEGIPILNFLVPKSFEHDDGKLTGMTFESVRAEYDENGRRKLVPTGEPDQHFECDDVLIAVGQENAFPWIERDIGLEFGEWDMPVVERTTFQSTIPNVFFGGDAAFGPENIIWAVAHGHEAAISIHKYCQGEDIANRLPRGMNLSSQKMGMHEWSYSNDYDPASRRLMPHVDLRKRFKNLDIEVELGFTVEQTIQEVERCLNCDIQTVFTESLCIECDACIDICPVNCLTITANGDEADLRSRLSAPAINPEQALYVSAELPQTLRVMVKDEDICVHCGLCAERCPTGAWDMQKSRVLIPYAADEAAGEMEEESSSAA